MQVTLIRHGKTAGNSELRYIGRTDEPLTGEGIAQVEAAGADSNVQTVYVSPLQRTRQTAQLLFPNARQQVVDDLREMDFGDFEGRTADEMVADRVYRAWVDGNCEGPCPNGESIESFCRRVGAAFEEAVRMAVGAGENILYLTAHGGTLMAIMSRFVKEPNSYYDWYVKNCCGWQGELDEAQWPDRLRLTRYSSFERLFHEDDV